MLGLDTEGGRAAPLIDQVHKLMHLWKGGDVAVIDGMVNGSAKAVGWIASVVRFFQTGHIYSYAFSMIIGLVVLMTFWVVRA